MARKSKTFPLIITTAIIALCFLIPSTPVLAEDSAIETLQKQGFIFLQVKIPSPLCLTGTGNANIKCCQDELIKKYVLEKNNPGGRPLDKKVEITCPEGSIAAVKNAPAFIVSFFQFGIIFLAILLVGVLAVAGVLYITSGGNPQQAGKAVDYIKNASLSLVVLLFSTVILNQIGPRFTSLGISHIENRGNVALCFENKSEKICIEQGCLWNADAKSCKDLATASCSDLKKPECDKLTGKCLWSTTANICTTVRNSASGSCSFADDMNKCVSSTGCAWDAACVARDMNNQTAVTQCDALTKPTACAQNALCEWKSPWCVLDTVARNRSCSDYAFANCPSVSCQTTPSRTCEAIKKPGETCGGILTQECGSTGFCNPQTKKCQAKLKGGESCESFGMNFDAACISGDCDATIGENTCTTP